MVGLKRKHSEASSSSSSSSAEVTRSLTNVAQHAHDDSPSKHPFVKIATEALELSPAQVDKYSLEQIDCMYAVLRDRDLLVSFSETEVEKMKNIVRPDLESDEAGTSTSSASSSTKNVKTCDVLAHGDYRDGFPLSAVLRASVSGQIIPALIWDAHLQKAIVNLGRVPMSITFNNSAFGGLSAREREAFPCNECESLLHVPSFQERSSFSFSVNTEVNNVYVSLSEAKKGSKYLRFNFGLKLNVSGMRRQDYSFNDFRVYLAKTVAEVENAVDLCCLKIRARGDNARNRMQSLGFAFRCVIRNFTIANHCDPEGRLLVSGYLDDHSAKKNCSIELID